MPRNHRRVHKGSQGGNDRLVVTGDLPHKHKRVATNETGTQAALRDGHFQVGA
jgi:hypothetical protein